MNKKQVNDWILPAQKAIIECGIAENGKVDSAWRRQGVALKAYYGYLLHHYRKKDERAEGRFRIYLRKRQPANKRTVYQRIHRHQACAEFL